MIQPGLLSVDKPIGPTSHDIVALARRAFGLKRVGHTGTLDPFASGLLVLCLGPATRLAEYWSGLDKSYQATLRLGVATDSLDVDGAEVSRDEAWRELDDTRIKNVFGGMVGAQQQVPPAYSAKKVGGVRAHRRARAGEEVRLDAVPVVIHQIECTEIALPFVSFQVSCSTGTYVRALARDLGEGLGTGAHLTELRRTSIDGLSVSAAVKPEDFGDLERTAAAWISPRDALPRMPSIELDDVQVERVRRGQAVTLEASSEDGSVALVQGATLVAVARAEGGRLHPKKVFTW